MAKMYQDQEVTVVRDAQEGDAGFVSGQDQVLIQIPGNPDPRVVGRSEVTTEGYGSTYGSTSGGYGSTASAPKAPERKVYQGQDVNLLREAREGDAGFVSGQDQVVIDGLRGDRHPKVVKRSELT